MHPKTIGLAIGLVFALGVTTPARAQTTTFTPSKDNTLYQVEHRQHKQRAGRKPVRRAERTTAAIRRALLAFDLSSIPSNATITAATLTLQCTKVAANTATNISLRRVSRNWGEGGSNAPDEEGNGDGCANERCDMDSRVLQHRAMGVSGRGFLRHGKRGHLRGRRR